MLRHLWIAKLANRFRLYQRKPPVNPRPAVKLHLESLEERVVPATYDVSTVAQLQTAITAINAGSSTLDFIVLAPGTYKLKNELTISNPFDQVTIEGSTSSAGDTIIKAGGGQRAFLLENANIAFQNLTIEDGTARDDGTTNPNTPAEGGGILEKGGIVALTNVVLQDNKALGNPNEEAKGGGVYVSGGSLNITSSVVQKNQAVGGVGAGSSTSTAFPNPGHNGAGGGIYVNAGSSHIALAINNSTLTDNIAQGGNGQVGLAAVGQGHGGSGGNAFGGAVYAAAFEQGGTLDLSVSGTTVTGNKALGGQGGQGAAAPTNGSSQLGGEGGAGGDALGGGFYLAVEDSLITAPTISSTSFSGNVAKGGAGGLGGSGGITALAIEGGSGGIGGAAAGGGLYNVATLLSLELSALVDNSVTGGQGGDGGSFSGAGGQGGDATGGGGSVVEGGSVAMTSSISSGNIVHGGNGGAGGLNILFQEGGDGTGGNAGGAFGGGFESDNSTVKLFESTVSGNSLTGGNGGVGGNGVTNVGGAQPALGAPDGGNGGVGGSVAGGGVNISGVGSIPLSDPNSNTIFSDALINSTIANNTIKAGKGGAGGTGGEANFTDDRIPGNGGNGGNGGTAQGAGAYFNVPVPDIVLGSQGSSPPLDGDGGNMGPLLQGQSQQSTYGVLLVNDTVAYNTATHAKGGAGGDAGAPLPSGGGLGQDGVSGGMTKSQGGGIVNAANEGVSLINTLVALNTADEDADYDGEVDHTDHNLIGDDSGSFGFSTANGDQLGTKAQPLDPGLGQLADNGGPLVGAPGQQQTIQTIALQPGSLAINAGDNSAIGFTDSQDERGDVREGTDEDPIDIGAYEVEPSFDQGGNQGA